MSCKQKLIEKRIILIKIEIQKSSRHQFDGEEIVPDEEIVLEKLPEVSPKVQEVEVTPPPNSKDKIRELCDQLKRFPNNSRAIQSEIKKTFLESVDSIVKVEQDFAAIDVILKQFENSFIQIFTIQHFIALPSKKEHLDAMAKILMNVYDPQLIRRLPTQLLWDLLGSGQLNSYTQTFDRICEEIRCRNDDPPNAIQNLLGEENGVISKLSNDLLLDFFDWKGVQEDFDLVKKFYQQSIARNLNDLNRQCRDIIAEMIGYTHGHKLHQYLEDELLFDLIKDNKIQETVMAELYLVAIDKNNKLLKDKCKGYFSKCFKKGHIFVGCRRTDVLLDLSDKNELELTIKDLEAMYPGTTDDKENELRVRCLNKAATLLEKKSGTSVITTNDFYQRAVSAKDDLLQKRFLNVIFSTLIEGDNKTFLFLIEHRESLILDLIKKAQSSSNIHFLHKYYRVLISATLLDDYRIFVKKESLIKDCIDAMIVSFKNNRPDHLNIPRPELLLDLLKIGNQHHRLQIL